MKIAATALLLLLHGGCTTSSAPPANQPQVKSVELTEPWKSMNLPIDGAVVERSSHQVLGVRFVTIRPEDAALPYAALKEALLEEGWVVIYSQAGPPMWTTDFDAPGFSNVNLSVRLKKGRPFASINGLAK